MRRIAPLAAAAVLAAAAGCGTATASPGAAPPGRPTPGAFAREASAAFNDADVAFLQMMIPHHRQGMRMAGLAAERATRPDVRALGAAVAATQGDEVRDMTMWLLGWRRPLDAAPHAHDEHARLHATDPAGIDALGRLTGARFEQTFLNMLIAHQHNAVEMARTETRTGVSPEAKDLARRIDLSRTAQIRQMLGQLGTG
ncbi:DUF305 domain-containing protein [Sphaerisporangium aureirubrum]|uniref:DUF305 domain-containing protein n=1 Tax=Sphaerisporangium aureirubrum TaxID=1544736 RepID=A0ABW1NIR1_9ACTN